MMNWLHLVVRRPRMAKALKVLLLLICISGLTPSVFAQIIDKGEYVEIVKGTQLCSNVSLKQKKDISHPGRVFLESDEQHAIQRHADRVGLPP